MYATRIVFLVCLLLTVVTVDLCGQTEASRDPVWSKEATMLSFQRGGRKMSVLSPDHRKIVNVSDTSIGVSENGGELTGIENLGIDALAELLWAPNSGAFVVTSSDGGIVGTWDVRLFLLSGNVVQAAAIASQVRADFKTRFKCQDNEDPNLAALKWVDASASQLIIVAEVPPHSSCTGMGRIAGYGVSVPSGRILRRYSGSELRERWGQALGQRLQNDRDLR
jgi:hypothetical protein